MKHLFNFFILLLINLMIIGCCAQKRVINQEILGTSMKYALVIENATEYQVDSLINADTLPPLEKWIPSMFVDYTTNERITKRMYIKQYSNKSEVVYIITGLNEPFDIVKRIKK